MGKLDPDDARPPYLQVAEAIRSDIAGGSFQPGDKLPNHQTLRDEYGVSLGTVKRALGELQGAGLVVSRQGQGAYIRTQLPDAVVQHPDAVVDELRRSLAALSKRVDAIEKQLGRP